MSNLKSDSSKTVGQKNPVSCQLPYTYFHYDESSGFCDILVRKKLSGCCRYVDLPRLKAQQNNQLFAEVVAENKQDNFSEHRCYWKGGGCVVSYV
jgi:hypothetical protein